MIQSILLIIFYCIIGIAGSRHLFPKKNNASRMFVIAYAFSLSFVITYYLCMVFVFDLNYNKIEPIVKGIFQSDAWGYHTSAVYIAENSLHYDIGSVFSKSWALLWEYVVGIHYYVWGINPLFPNIFNAFIFSFGAVVFFELSQLITNNDEQSAVSYNLYCTFLPMLYMNSAMMKESLLLVLEILFLYSFYHYLLKRNTAAIVAIVFSFLLMLVTRYVYAFSALMAVTVVLFALSQVRWYKKVIIIFIITIVPYVLLQSTIGESIGLMNVISGTQTGRHYYIATGRVGGISIEDLSPLGIFSVVRDNLSVLLKMPMEGGFHFFFRPIPYNILEFDSSDTTEHFYIAYSIYNCAYYIIIPGIVTGMILKYKRKQFSLYDYPLIIHFVIIFVLVIFNNADPIRYRTAVVPFLFPYAAIGLHYLRTEKKYGSFVLVLLSGPLIFVMLLTIFTEIR